MSIKFKSNEQGKCPLCNSMNLSYDTMEIDDGLGNSCYYPWHCDDCGADGKEWYYVDFSEIIANTSDGDVTGSEEGVCPECGEGINYFSSEPDGESLGYEFECPACGVSGTEWYDMSFDSHTIDGHEDEVIDVMTEAIQKQESKKVTEETNLEPIVSSINADSCKVNDDIVTGSAELVQYDGSEYNPVSDEFTFEYNRKDKTIKVTSDNKKEIVKDLDEEEIINNLEDNILPEITKTTEGKDTKVESKEAPLFKKKINKTDMKKVEDKEPKKHVINKVDLRKTESKEARIARIKESIERHKVQEAKAKKNEALKGKIEEGLTRFLKETYKNGKEIKIESIIRLKENRLFAKGSLVMENSTKKFSCSLVPVKEGKTFRSYTIKENKLLKIEEGKTSKGKSFNLIVRK